ncbi:MAG: hypothetical protein JEZ06_04940 [Anaerolineaceae bacterium]|nr:hypothetical protein [Anaerolineaceae bacterium]
MLPKNVIIRTEKNVLYWKNTTFNIDVDEAKIMADEIDRLAQKPEVSVLLVNNQGVKGAWPVDVNPIWGELMGKLSKNIQKSATVAKNIVVMQINRISKESGTLEQIRGFTNMDEAKKFLDITEISLD